MQNEPFFQKLERDLFDAHVRADVPFLRSMYAEDFFSTNADGRTVNKEQWLTMVGSGQFPVDAIQTGDFRLWRNGNIAVITGWSNYIRQDAVVWAVRHSQVWFYDGQRWLLQLWHGTPKA